MRIADGVYVLPIPRGSRGADGFLNLTLILDEQNGNTLVDAGLPGQAEAIGAALTEVGIGVRDLKRIIFTHQDLEPVRVDEHLEDGDRLDLAGGTRVIFTPGHTPGHLSLYLERPKILVAGDALTAEGGHLNGPNPSMPLDMRPAMQSIRRLADLEIDTIVCYHGGVVSEDANGQLRRVLQEVSREGDE